MCVCVGGGGYFLRLCYPSAVGEGGDKEGRVEGESGTGDLNGGNFEKSFKRIHLTINNKHGVSDSQMPSNP